MNLEQEPQSSQASQAAPAAPAALKPLRVRRKMREMCVPSTASSSTSYTGQKEKHIQAKLLKRKANRETALNNTLSPRVSRKLNFSSRTALSAKASRPSPDLKVLCISKEEKSGEQDTLKEAPTPETVEDLNPVQWGDDPPPKRKTSQQIKRDRENFDIDKLCPPGKLGKLGKSFSASLEPQATPTPTPTLGTLC